MNRSPQTMVGFVIAVVAIASCGSGNSASGEAALQQQRQEAAERERIETLLPTASETQQDVLADGHVTPGEADRAASDVVDCAAEQGVVVTPIWEDDGMSWHTAGGKTEASADAAYAVYASCHDELFELVASTLTLQNSLDPDDAERLYQLVNDCLVAEGIDVEGWPHVDAEIDGAVEATCFDLANEELGL